MIGVVLFKGLATKRILVRGIRGDTVLPECSYEKKKASAEMT